MKPAIIVEFLIICANFFTVGVICQVSWSGDPCSKVNTVLQYTPPPRGQMPETPIIGGT